MSIKGGEAVVKTLVSCGVATVYGQPGAHVLNIYEALRNEPRIRHVSAMHEINAGYMADAQGRLTGQPGVCLLTAGPGATNAVTAIAQAYAEASPVVQITGHCGISEKIQPLHGVDDWNFLLKIYSSITKWSAQISRVEDIASTLKKAFRVAASGRPGPVHIEIPRDVLGSSVIFQNPDNTASETENEMDEEAIKKIADVLVSSSRPVIAVGKGVLREFCWTDVMTLSQTLGAAIVTVQDAVSAIPYDFPLYVGYDLGWTPHRLIDSLIKEADVILTLGLDLGERMASLKAKDSALIHVYNDGAWSENQGLNESKHSKPQTDFAASVKRTVEMLLKLIPQGQQPRNTLEKRVLKIKKRVSEDVSASIKLGCKPIHPGEVGMQLRRVLDGDALLTLDVGDSSTWMHTCYRAAKSNTVLAPGRYSSMGFALPAAIAAKVNFPDRQVVAVTGDGGFFTSCMDFPTAVKERLGIKIIVMSNAHYGTIWHLQKRHCHRHTFATEVQVPDFAEYAQSFGAKGYNVDDSARLGNVLEEAISIDGPAIVGVHTDHRFPCFPARGLKQQIRRLADRIRE